MKRSQVNSSILWALGLLERQCFKLPRFGYWTAQDWIKNKAGTETVRSLMLGWDVTDFGTGCFEKTGAVLFTIRNGSPKDPSAGTPYAEKVIMLADGQSLPMHFHFTKTEDIINRGGGIICIQLYNARPDGSADHDTDVTVRADGMEITVKAGGILEITPGNSVTLRPRTYHLFGAKKGFGDVLAGEVSSVNDDSADNRFAEPVKRFSGIEEDEPALYPLCNEYEKLFSQEQIK